MITMNMTTKREVRITNKHFSLENNVLTLEINIGDYDITGKQITAVFEPKGIETAPFTAETVEGVTTVSLPIYSSYIAEGVNYIQLYFRWDTTKLEQSGKMMWVVERSLIADDPGVEQQDLMSYYLQQITLAIAEADRVVDEAGDVRDELDESTASATAINTTLTDPATGTIKLATDANATLNQSIVDAGVAKDALTDPVTGAIALAEAAEDAITNPTTGAIKLATDAEDSLQATIDASKIGVLANLTTTEKGTLVGAINEVDADLATHKAETDQRIDNIVTTPVPVGEIIAQEIIDARQGALSVGANITEVKSQLAEKASKVAQPWASLQLTPGAYSMAEGQSFDVDISQASAHVALWMQSDQNTLLGRSLTKTKLSWSIDEGVTWIDHSQTFTGGITTVRELDNGEIIVGANGTSTLDKSALWLSSGWSTDHATATFAKVLSIQGADNGTWRAWGLDNCGSLVLAAEYGEKASPTNMARYIFLSDDYGETWKIIFDYLTVSSGVNAHVHGVAYDPWWDAIWVCGGDSTVNNYGTYVSFDRGATWEKVKVDSQFTTISVLPNCILFTTDTSSTNGIYRINRTSPKNLNGEWAYKINELNIMTHYGFMGFRAKQVLGAPLLLSFFASGNAGYGKLIATHDGISFREIWEDNTSPATYNNAGLYSMVGPTKSGKYLGQLSRDVDYTAANTFSLKLTTGVAPEKYAGTLKRKMRTGCYYSTLISTAGLIGTAIGKDVMRVTPFEVGDVTPISKIGIEVVTAGDAGSVLQMVIYADDGTGKPGKLIYSGSVAGDAIAVVENDVAIVLQPGLYWVGATAQNYTTLAPIPRGIAAPSVVSPMVPLTLGTKPTTNQTATIGYAGVIGVPGSAAPSIFPNPSVTTVAPRIFVKIA